MTTKAFISSFCMNQLNFIHQRSVTSLLLSDSKYSKRTISAHSVACSRTPTCSNNCACSEGACRLRYCDNHAQKMQWRARLIQETTDCDSVQTLLTLSSALARAPFLSCLRDVHALILPRTQQVDLPKVYMLLVVALNLSEGCGVQTCSVISYTKRLDHVCAFA